MVNPKWTTRKFLTGTLDEIVDHQDQEISIFDDFQNYMWILLFVMLYALFTWIRGKIKKDSKPFEKHFETWKRLKSKLFWNYSIIAATVMYIQACRTSGK